MECKEDVSLLRRNNDNGHYLLSAACQAGYLARCLHSSSQLLFYHPVGKFPVVKLNQYSMLSVDCEGSNEHTPGA